jgi:hypothetical protein
VINGARRADTRAVETLNQRDVGSRVLFAAVGALSLVVGLLILGGELTSGPGDSRFLLAGGVASVGGAALIFLHRLGLRPTAAGWATAVVAALLGTGLGLLRRIQDVCCMFAYLVAHGYPFTWLRRGATGETASAARSLAVRSQWHLHWSALIADLLFWGLVGMLTAVAAALVRRARLARSPSLTDDQR